MSLLSFFIVPAFILQGYLVKIVRQVMGGDDDKLPEWMDYGSCYATASSSLSASLSGPCPSFC